MENEKLNTIRSVTQKALEDNETPEKAKIKFTKTLIEGATGRKISSDQVFVVVTHYMGGTQAEQIFAYEKSAQNYINTRKDEGGRPTIERFFVRGTQESPDFAFTSGFYESAIDIHHLVGIFGNYDDAKKAAGEHGEVLRKEIRKN